MNKDMLEFLELLGKMEKEDNRESACDDGQPMELGENLNLIINPLPLPGRKNGLSTENAFPVSSVSEEYRIIDWLSAHAGKSRWGGNSSARYKIIQQTLYGNDVDKAYDRLTVEFYDEKGFLIRRAGYHFDISSFYFRDDEDEKEE